jgi:hypothetical protein
MPPLLRRRRRPGSSPGHADRRQSETAAGPAGGRTDVPAAGRRIRHQRRVRLGGRQRQDMAAHRVTSAQPRSCRISTSAPSRGAALPNAPAAAAKDLKAAPGREQGTAGPRGDAAGPPGLYQELLPGPGPAPGHSRPGSGDLRQRFEIPRNSADRTGTRPAGQRRQMVARVLTERLGLVTHRCALRRGGLCVYRRVHRLQPIADVHCCQPVDRRANRPQDQIAERAGPQGRRTGVTAWSPQPRRSP